MEKNILWLKRLLIKAMLNEGEKIKKSIEQTFFIQRET